MDASRQEAGPFEAPRLSFRVVGKQAGIGMAGGEVEQDRDGLGEQPGRPAGRARDGASTGIRPFGLIARQASVAVSAPPRSPRDLIRTSS